MTWLLLWLGAARGETPLTLEDAVRLAIERNPSVRSAALAQTFASISASRARLDRFTATVGVDGLLGARVQAPAGADPFSTSAATADARATLVVPVFAGGRVAAQIDRADAGLGIAEADRRLTERDIARAAYTAYWNIKGFELQIRAAEEGLAATEEALAIIRAKADAGLAAGIDVNRSTVDLYAQQDALLAQRAALVGARQDLVRLLHLEDDAIRLVDDPPAAATGPVALPDDPLAGRPERARQDLLVAQADADVRAARSAALPSVALTADAGAGGTSLGQDPDPALFPVDHDLEQLGTVDAGVGVQLAWTPFDLFRTRDAVRQARLLAAQVEAQNEAENDRIAAELRASAAQLQALRDRAPIVDQQVALARDNLTIVQDLYAQGSATILDLFNAQSSFRSALIQQAGLAVDLAAAELDLRWQLGADLPGATP